MSAELIAKRYARALKEIASGDLEKAKGYLDALELVVEIFDDKEIAKVLKSPVVPAELKIDVLTAAVSQVSDDKTLRAFVEVVGGAGRAALVPLMVKELEKAIHEEEGLLDAELTTVVELTSDDLAAVKEKIEKIVGKSVILTQKVDSSILGGFVARFGNNVLDMSLKSKLGAMTQTAVR